MCGRFAAGDMTQRQMAALMDYFLYGKLLPDGSAPNAGKGYHIKPTDLINIAFAKDEGFLMSAAKWQMTPKANSRPVINSKIENVDFWASHWQGGRCIIPAIGYYEWSEVEGRKEPYFVSVKRNTPLLFFAGFYDRAVSGQLTCSIITREPAAQIAHLHHRMPVIMSPEQIQDWLTYEMDAHQAQKELGTNWGGRFEFHRVAPIQSSNDSAEMIELYDPPQASFDF